MPWLRHPIATHFSGTNYWLIMLARRCWSKGMLKSCCRIYMPCKNDVFLYFSFRYVSTHFHEFPMKLSNDFLWFSMVFHEFPIKRMFSYGLPTVSHEISTPPWPRMQLANPRRPGCTHWSLDTNIVVLFYMVFIWFYGFIAQKRLFCMVL